MMLSPILMAAFAAAQPAPHYMARLPPCQSADARIAEPCNLPLRMSADEVRRRMTNRDSIWWIEDDRLTFIARPTLEPWVMLCCAIQSALEPISGTDFAGAVVRIPRLNEVILDIRPNPAPARAPDIWRGSKAPRAPDAAAPLRGMLQTVSLTSTHLDDQRAITVYVPPHDGNVPLPVFYLADGASAVFAAIAEAAVDRGDARPAILVGIHNAPPDEKPCEVRPCDRRSLEYLVDLSGESANEDSFFRRHMRFVIEDVLPYVEAHYPASKHRRDRAVGGYSNGGAWAFAAAEMHPDLFGNVMGLSSGSKTAMTYAGRLKTVRVYGGSGIFEGNFHLYTKNTVANAVAAGADGRERSLVTGHSYLAWDVFFEDAFTWFFGNNPDSDGGRN